MWIKTSLLHLIIPLTIITFAYTDNLTDTSTCETFQQPGPWSCLLEEWATTPLDVHRQGRILSLPNKGYYITDRIDLVPPPVPRPYDEWQPPSSGPGKIVNRPQKPYNEFKPSAPYNPQPSQPQSQPPQKYPPPQQAPNKYPQPPSPQKYPQKPPPPRPAAADRVDPAPPRKEVSETDLYLLGAIEKLVYRVDLMEKRLRKMEESVHFIVAGKDKAPEPCVENFSRVGAQCYHFSAEALDWKSANLACRKLRSNLLELDTDQESRQMLAAVHADKRIRELDFWTSGLNPGLLWIWSGSARPVISNSTQTTEGNSSQAVTIVGDGRCLALVYDPSVKTHVYRGQDCAFRHRYVCEKSEDKSKLSNEIERVSRTLKLVEGTVRKSKILWTQHQLPSY